MCRYDSDSFKSVGAEQGGHLLSKLKILTITLSAWAVWPHRGKGLIYALLDSAILCILCGLEECQVGEDLKRKIREKVVIIYLHQQDSYCLL